MLGYWDVGLLGCWAVEKDSRLRWEGSATAVERATDKVLWLERCQK